MKINAFVRLIRTIACGVVVLGASNVLGQVNSDITDGGATFGTLESVDENGNAGETFTQTQAPAVGDTSGSSSRQIYYPPGMEIPLTEREIPGSAYFTGPDGERIDPSEMMNQVPAGQERVIQNKDSVQLSPGQSFSLEGTYDGTLAFPMGTFPTTPFGERIISQVPAGESTADESESGEIPGALLDENGKPVDVAADNDATPEMENGVPVDQIVRPDNSPKSVVKDEARGQATRVFKPNQPGGIQGLKGEVKVFIDPHTGQVTLGGDEEDTALVAKAMRDLNKQDPKAAEAAKKMASRQNRLRQRLQDALSEKERLSGLLRKAKADSQKSVEDKSVEELQAKLKTAETEKADLLKLMKLASETAKLEISGAAKKLKMTEKRLNESRRLREGTKKMMDDAQKAAQEKILALETKAKENALQAEALERELIVAKQEQKAYRRASEARLAAAKADAEKARAEVLALTEKIVADSEATDAAAVGIAAGADDMIAPGEDEIGAVAAQASDDMANKAKEAKAAAELEVSRKLKEMEERKKAADAAKDAAEDADVEKEEMAKEEMANGEDGKEAVLSLDDQIKRLKAKRDQQIAESETRIRAKQQREIDKLLEEGKAVDSDEVKAAVEKMKGAIKTSEEKLRSRFLRRLERLKEDMKKSLK